MTHNAMEEAQKQLENGTFDSGEKSQEEAHDEKNDELCDTASSKDDEPSVDKEYNEVNTDGWS